MKHLASLVILLASCAGASESARPDAPYETFPLAAAPHDLELATAPAAAVAPMPAAPAPGVMAEGPVGAPATPPPRTEAPRVMMDIEAWITIETENVLDAASELRRLVRQFGGALIVDQIDQEYSAPQGTFDGRVPAEQVEAFLEAVGQLGRVRSRNVRARDVGKEFHDAQLVLRNLEAALRRYEEMLVRAQNVSEMLAIEEQMTRVRGQIDQTQGTLRWLADRVALATVHVVLLPRRLDGVGFAPNSEAKFYPGLRALYALSLSPGLRRSAYGAGLSVQLSRELSFDLDLLTVAGGPSLLDGADLILLTLGGEAYSDFLGRGRDRLMNPYLGWRLGFAREQAKNGAALGATVGVEIYKIEQALLGAELRAMALVGGRGLRVLLEPALALNVAF